MRFRRSIIITICALLAAKFTARAGEPAAFPWERFALPRVTRDDPALQGGGGVVHWQTYGADVFERARREEKPVFVFVTGNAFPRGKAMERIAFTDLSLATRLNEVFIPVRVDAERRPDVALRMQQIAQAFSGGRGLPLTVVLTPDGEPWFGGTSFLPDDDPQTQRPGLRGVLYRMAEAWREQRAAVMDDARRMGAALQKTLAEENTRGGSPAKWVERFTARALKLLDAQAAQRSDPAADAGISAGALFPAPRVIDFCLTQFERTGDKRSRDAACAVLDAMLRGGIYDSLAGGFFRCSTDGRWGVPRFEKQLAVNAELLRVYAKAFRLTGDKRFRVAAEKTIEFWSTVMQADDELFFSSQAGGSGDIDDGVYFTWTVHEIEALLSDETDCRLAKTFFDIGEHGNLPASQPERNVLFEAMPLEEAAHRVGITPADARTRLAAIRVTLLRARNARPAPTIDRSVYVDANALMAAALMECGRDLKHPELTARGVRMLRTLLDRGECVLPAFALAQPSHVGRAFLPAFPMAQRAQLHRVAHTLQPRGADSRAPALLQDAAALTYACAVAAEITADETFAKACDFGVQRLAVQFWDPSRGGFRDCAADVFPESENCAWPLRIFQDTGEPSPNGLAALACAKLAALTKRREPAEQARGIIEAFTGVIEAAAPHTATLCEARLLLELSQ